MGSDFEGGIYGFEMAVAHGRDLEISTIVECTVVVGVVHRHKSRPKNYGQCSDLARPESRSNSSILAWRVVMSTVCKWRRTLVQVSDKNSLPCSEQRPTESAANSLNRRYVD